MQKMKVDVSHIIDVPSWVNWMAVDYNGDCFGYEVKPTTSMADQWWGNRSGRYQRLYSGNKPKNRKDELYMWG